MKLAFTGDLSFDNLEKYTKNPFNQIKNELRGLKLIINLESPFLPKGYSKGPIKQKICLKQDNKC